MVGLCVHVVYSIFPVVVWSTGQSKTTLLYNELAHLAVFVGALYPATKQANCNHFFLVISKLNNDFCRKRQSDGGKKLLKPTKKHLNMTKKGRNITSHKR